MDVDGGLSNGLHYNGVNGCQLPDVNWLINGYIDNGYNDNDNGYSILTIMVIIMVKDNG